MLKLFSIALGGSLGAVMRFSVSYFLGKNFISNYPWATFVVNLFGAFLIGFFWGFFEKTNYSENMKAFVLTGTIGSFTTFSTLSLETIKLFQNGQTKLGLFHIGITNILGLVLVVAGFLISRQINVALQKA
jgi:CrcB protein